MFLMAQPLLKIENLHTYFRTDKGIIKAVEGLSIDIEEGKTLAVVGESGSGKSVTSLSVMQLLSQAAQIESGSIWFLGRDLVRLPEPEMRQIRGAEISIIFQEPMTSLNPVLTVGFQVMEALIMHQGISKIEARQRTIELFDEVGILEPDQRVDSYPHEMSGGQIQRVMIAMALSCSPKLLIADEPTTALDVTMQAQILDTLRELRDRRGLSILFITHDLGVVAEIADDVAVMLRGKVVEYGPVADIFNSGQHPYTRGLLSCRPRLDSKFKRLPTVEDYMKIETDIDGDIQVVEKTLDAERITYFNTAGRGRLLHPQHELEALGYTLDPGIDAADTQIISVDEPPLLDVEDLRVHFPIRKGLLSRTVGQVKAVDGISFRVYRGQTLGLVGESGCGKTTCGRAILRLIEPTGGCVRYDGTDIGSLGSAQMRRIRKRMQLVFQDPYGSMNPRMTVQSTLVEPMKVQGIGANTADRRERAVALLEEVGMEAAHLPRYPHEFSGGQRQRICIARALTVEPEFIICDESVSALDVSIQAQVLNLLKDLQERRGLTYVFISHDLSVVKFMADMMAVMNEGKIVEFGPSENIYTDPREDYTKRLIDATPKDDLKNIKIRQAAREAVRQRRKYN